jgi:hypothetical protein
MSMTNFHDPRLRRQRVVRSACLVALVCVAYPFASDAQQPTPQQQNAIRQSCRSDFQANCAGVPAGGPEALQCLKQNVPRASPACQQALAPVMSSAATPATGGAPASATGAAATTPPGAAPPRAPASNSGQAGATGGGQPPSMREELMLTREMCGAEFRSYCANVPLGGGRAIQCLEANAANLSPRCKGALAEIRARR